MAHRGPVDEDDVVGKAQVFHLVEPAHVHVDELAQELVVVAEAVGAFVIEHLDGEVEGGRDQFRGHGPARGRADAHRREQRLRPFAGARLIRRVASHVLEQKGSETNYSAAQTLAAM